MRAPNNVPDGRKLSPTTDAFLSQVIEAVDDPVTITGIILYGSWAKTSNDRSSDIDLLVIQRSGSMVQETCSILDTDVDIYKGTWTTLRQRLYIDDPLNNNFILNALSEGVICLDRTGSAGALMAAADVLWQTGPPAMSPAEANATRKALYRMLRAAKQLSRRSSTSREAALIASLRSSQVVIQSVYLYHRVRRLWTSSLPQVLGRLETENSVLYELWKQYVDAHSQEQRIQLASLFVESVYE